MFDLRSFFNKIFQQRFQRWISQRIPSANEHLLDHRRIFIFPSRQGFMFLFLLALMLSAAINYENNLAFALTFWLIGLFAVSILHTFANLSGISVQALQASDVFAGDRARFTFLLRRNNSRERYAIRIGWPNENVVELSLRDSDEKVVELFFSTSRRGWLKPGRLLLETYFPLGLLRAWTWLEFDLAALVYPQPIQHQRHPVQIDSDNEGEGKPILHGQNDFDGLRDYQPGDSLRRIFWPSVARDQIPQVKMWIDHATDSRVYSWQDYPQLNTEQRLSALCFDVLTASNCHEIYSLQLPTISLPPGADVNQRHRALRALALHGLHDKPQTMNAKVVARAS
jgi:uncharacterized protein (DUF58 family)